MQGYCVRCKQKQKMLSATRTLMKNGRRAMIGACACCGTKMHVAGVWENAAPLSPEALAVPPPAQIPLPSGTDPPPSQ